jgi:hypothetical protein
MKIKHKYRVHHLLDCYPTEEDALFDICNFLLEKRGKLKDEWSDVGIRPAFHKKLDEEEINKLLQSLVQRGYLSFREGSGKKNYYTILKHDFGTSYPLEAITDKEEQQ